MAEGGSDGRADRGPTGTSPYGKHSCCLVEILHGLSRTQADRGSLLDQAIGAYVTLAEDGAGNSKDLSSKLERAVGGYGGSALLARLNHDDRIAESRKNPDSGVERAREPLGSLEATR